MYRLIHLTLMFCVFFASDVEGQNEGCLDPIACNYDANATEEDTCDYCSCAEPEYSLTVETHLENGVEGYTTYRFYLDMVNPDDFLSAVYGNSDLPLGLHFSEGFYNSEFTSGATAGGVNEAFFALFPSAALDSWVTIGIDSEPENGETAVSLGYAQDYPWMNSFQFGSDLAGTDVVMNDAAGGTWYVLNGATNGLPDEVNGRVLIMQITTTGEFWGTLNFQIFENGEGSQEVTKTLSYDGLGTFYPVDSDVAIYSECGCLDATACNFDEEATLDDGSCLYVIPAEACDCEGNFPEEGYDCDGICLNDLDNDGICDAFEGCTSEDAVNYDPESLDDDGSCVDFTFALSLAGVMDFTVPTGTIDGKAIHLQATADILDLSIFGVGVANNGEGSDGQEYTLPSLSVEVGDDILLVRNQEALDLYLQNCFDEFEVVIVTGNWMNHNGDDAIELFEWNTVIETFGDVNVDGTGQSWEYQDSWAYKSNNVWEYGGVNCTDGTLNTQNSYCLYPHCSSDIEITFNVNMANETVAESGVYIVLSAISVPGDYPMEDEDGNGIYSITLEFTPPFTGNYTFLNGNCGDYSCKENLAGQDCADGTWNDRLLDYITEDTVVNTCFGECSEDGSCTAQVPVVFQLDMGQYIGNYEEVNIAGSFNGWNLIPMTDTDNDQIFTASISMIEGETYKYNFFLDGWDVGELLDENSPCVVNENGFINRWVTVDSSVETLDAVCFNSCFACSGSELESGPVTFQVDMSGEEFTGEVFLFAEFDEFALPGRQMEAVDGNGLYTLTVENVEEGEWLYRFYIDNCPDESDGLDSSCWQFENMDENAACAGWIDENFIQRVLYYEGGDLILEPVCWESCTACEEGNETACGLFFSEYAEGTSNNRYLEIYNPTASAVFLSQYTLGNCLNGCDNPDDPYLSNQFDYFTFNFPFDATIAPGGTYIVAKESADATILSVADVTYQFLSNGDDAWGLFELTATDTILVDLIGEIGPDPGAGWEVGGIVNATQNHTLVRKEYVFAGNGGDWAMSAGTNAIDSEWIVYDQDTWGYLGGHTSFSCGAGCIFDNACNFDPAATADDGSCIFICQGCADPVACNYVDWATEDDGSCSYPEDLYGDSYLDCFGLCLSDLDMDGICDENEVNGCLDESACNYDSNATDDDGTCEFESCSGCSNASACNYDSSATILDDSCEYESCAGCMYEAACNFDPTATIAYNESCIFDTCNCTDPEACNYEADATDADGSCIYPDAGLDCQGNCLLGVTLDLVFDNYAEETSWGILDDAGNTLASGGGYSNGTESVTETVCLPAGTYTFTIFDLFGDGFCCVYGDGSYTLTDAEGNGLAIGGEFGSSESTEFCIGDCNHAGCTDFSACNFDSEATDNDGSCVHADAGYDCSGNCIADADLDGICDAFEVEGCIDSVAVNYDEDATEDNGSCVYGLNSLQLKGVLSITTTSGAYLGSAIHVRAIEFLEETEGFGLGVVNGGGGSDGVEYEFQLENVQPEDDILVVRSEEFYNTYFGSCITEFEHVIVASSWMNHNGDEAIELFHNGNVIETFGNTTEDGTGTDWDYTGTWAFRIENDWEFGTPSCSDAPLNELSSCPYPLCSNTNDVPWPQIGQTIQSSGSLELGDVDISDQGDAMVVTYPFGGKAEIYNLNADSLWVLSQSIAMNALWEESTAISGDGLTVAFANNQQGEVGIDVYTRTESVWENLGDRIEVESVGDKVALAISEDGNRLVYGVMHGDYVHNNAGYARVLEWNGTGWVQLGSDFYGGGESWYFGNDVAISDDGQIIAIASLNDGSAGHNKGSCTSYSWDENQWSQRGNKINGVATYDQLHAIDMSGDGNRLVLGSFGNDAGGNRAGQIRFFDWNANNQYWNSFSTITGTFEDQRLGSTVCISGNGKYAAAHQYEIWNGGVQQYRIIGDNVTVQADFSYPCNECHFGESIDLNYDGMTLATSTWYDPEAGPISDGTAMAFQIHVPEPCEDEQACNFGILAPCDYPETYYDCDGNCLSDADGDGTCDALEIAGCQDTYACNYDPDATDDNGSCDYSCQCQDESACNYGEVIGDVSPALLVHLWDFNFESLNDPIWFVEGFDDEGFIDNYIGTTSDLFLAEEIDLTACWTIESMQVPEFFVGSLEVILFDLCNPEENNCRYEMGMNFLVDTLDLAYGVPSSLEICVSDYVSAGCVYPDFGYDCEGFCLSDTDDDQICDALEIGGCTDESASNYNGAATDDDGSCEFQGCTSESACNYDAGAQQDDGSCVYAETNYDCEGNCLNDTDGDGVCNEMEIVGCNDLAACNYDSAVTEPDDSCDFCSCATGQPVYSMTIETHVEEALPGLTTYRFYLNLLNVGDYVHSAGVLDASLPMILTTSQGFFNYGVGSWTGTEIQGAWLPFLPDLGADSWVTVGHDVIPSNEEEISTSGSVFLDHFDIGALSGQNIYTTDPNDLWTISPINEGSLAYGDEDNRVLLMQLTTAGDFEGAMGCRGQFGDSATDLYFEFDGPGIFATQGNSLAEGNVCGCTDAEANNYSPNVEYDDGSCLFGIGGCQDEVACNYNDSADYDDGSCGYANPNYDCEGFCLLDTDNDEVCDAFEIPGCMESSACNYDSDATDDDASCTYADQGYNCAGNCLADTDGDDICDQFEVTGCQDETACNYHSAATDDGECVFADGVCESCSGDTDGTGTVVDNDEDNDAVCDADEIIGCQDETACNYNSTATNDGECVFADGVCESCSGETDGTGIVVNNDQDNDDVCDADEIIGCQDDTACNYNSTATDDGECVFADGVCESCSGETDGTGIVVNNDQDNDDVCDADEIIGCQDDTACNYDAAATDDGECIFADGVCESCSGETDGTGIVVNNDQDNDAVCDADEIIGCQDDTACNYDAAATDLGCCLYAEPEYDCAGTCLNDEDQDGTCDAFEVPGCMENMACNYNADATDADGSCVYAASGYDCAGNCLFDVDNDDVCDQEEVTGCQDASACNFNGLATDAGTCLYAETGYDCAGTCLNDEDQDGTCDAFEVPGCMENMACNYNADATDADGSCVYAASGYDCAGNCLFDVDNDDVCDQEEVTGCQDASACNFNGLATDAGTCLYAETGYDCAGTCLNDTDQDGTCDAFEVPGCMENMACNYNADATDADGSCVYAESGYDCSGNCLFDVDNDDVCDQEEVTGCQDDSACNFNGLATDAGTCLYAETGYDCAGTCLNDTDQDGTCDAFEVPGCMENMACNYNADATDADGSCVYAESGYDCSGNCLFDVDNDDVCDQEEVTGCQDDSACNFNGLATDAGTCLYAEAGYDCQGTCLNDEDQDGTCDAFEVPGCMENMACNYNADATDADGSCVYAESGYDCLGNCLFDVDNDDVCDQEEVTGCQDASACNFNGLATDAGTCLYAETGYDCAGTCLNDTDQDGTCDAFEVPGCMENMACNYNADATDADESCVYAASGYDCSGNCLFDVDNDDVCDQEEVTGCQDGSACNFNGLATDAGTCLYAEAGYDCQGTCLNDEDQDGTCDAFEVPGCMENMACNYNADATDADGSCVYAESGYDCAGNCLFDVDNDDVCDQEEVTGCQDDSACNFNGLATDAGTCLYAETGYDCAGTCLNDTDQDGTCDAFEVPGCMENMACNYNADATDADESCVYAASGYDCSGNCLFDVDNDDVCDQEEVTGCQDDSACNFNGLATDAGTCLYAEAGYDCQGTCLNDEDQDGTCDAFEVPGCMENMACNYNADATDADGSCVYAASGYDCAGNCLFDVDNDDVCDQEEVTGCQDDSACNFNGLATDAGTCLYAEPEYDCQGTCLNDEDQNGTCDAFEVPGCMENMACNYNADATDADGSCSYADAGYDCLGNCLFDVDNDDVCDQEEVTGCQDDSACNYNGLATDAGTCLYAEAGYDCAGTCLNDTDQDGTCDAFEVPGCMENMACNYNADATDADESCVYAASGYDCSGNCLIDTDGDDICDEDEPVGCTYLSACNYSDTAEFDDGTCVFSDPGMDCNGDWLEQCQDDDSCVTDINNDGVTGTTDLLLVLSGYGQSCDD